MPRAFTRMLPSRMSLRSHLLALVLVPLIPVLIFSTVLVVAFARQERAAVERGSRETARAMAAAIDQHLESAIAALSSLALSSRLERGDLTAFYEEARALRASRDAWEGVFIADTEGRGLLNVRVPLGAPLPAPGDYEAFRRVVATQRPVVSDLILGRLVGRYVALVMVPVRVGGEVRYVLGASINVQKGIDALFAGQRVPADATAVVFDRRKTIVARTRDGETLVGKPVTDRLAEESNARTEGSFADVTLEGIPVYSAFSRAPVSGWTVAIGLSAERVDASLRRSLLVLVGSALGILVLAGALAVTVGRRLATSIESLSPAARALARGEALPERVPSAVREVETVARDLTEAAAMLSERALERRRTEEERARLLARAEAARGQAEVANRTKDEFLATVSHELRTPLTAILGWARMLRTRRLGAEAMERGLEIIDRNARHQAQLIEDLLDVSRIITGKLRLDIRAIEIVAVVHGALDAVRGAAEAKGLVIDTALEGDVGPVRGDPDRLQQVVWNLVSNAIKFTPPGGRVRVAAHAVDGHAHIEVSDTGKGIERDFLPFVFDRFRQSDSARADGGLGLGLSLVRHLTELHGGTVHVASEGPGRGATFTVRLPLATGREAGPMTESSSPPERFPSLAGVRVLVVDDDHDARQLLAMILEQCSAEVTTAASVTEAMLRFDEERIDVVISDINMPVNDGYALVRDLRARGVDAPRVPMLALTASARGEDRRRALAAGYDVHVAKPVEPAALAEIVYELAAGARRAREAGAVTGRV